MINLLASDLDHILAHTEGLWEELRGQRIFITGGTGFFGCWLLESFAWINDKLGLGASALVLTRNLEAFKKKAPHLASHPSIHFLEGDVRSFEFPSGAFSHIIHAATETNTQLDNPDTLKMFMTSFEGTQRALDFAIRSGSKKFLFISSGAVYGKQPSECTHISEDYQGAPLPLDLNSAYGHGKRAAEFLCSVYTERSSLETKIARCFAFVGPYLFLNSGFAIGNFILDILTGRPIQIKGDGTPYRSYLYAADLMIWLWTILIKGICAHPYNVGSEHDLTIYDLALEVTKALNPNAKIDVARRSTLEQRAERYVPSTKRAQRELGLKELIPLAEGIKRTAGWYSEGGRLNNYLIPQKGHSPL